MSFFSSGKSNNKDPFSKKSQFYVEFLGWMETRGVRGQRYTDPVIRELRRRQKKMESYPKLTIQVSKKDLKITHDVEEKKKRGIKKIKYPSIPARDVTFVHQATRPGDGRLDDIVACIYLGYMPRTQRYVHVHVYRFDEASTATTFASQMAALVEANVEHIREVEIDLANKGEIDDPRLTSSDGMSEPHTTDSAVGSASSAYSDDESPTFGSDEIDPDLISLKDVQPYDNVASELKHRLHIHETPLLLPPKDYDTISRAHGNLENINKRRSQNVNVVGETAVSRDRNGSNESGVDLASPDSDAAESSERIPADIAPSPRPHKLDVFRDSPAVSPHQNHKAMSFQEAKISPQVPQKPMIFPEARHSPQVPQKPIFPDSEIYSYPKPGYHSGPVSPGTPPPGADFVYPPKVTSPPLSPRLYRAPHGKVLSRQNSQNSQLSDGPRLNNSFDHEGRVGTPIQYYKAGSNNDIYAMPNKGLKSPNNYSPREELPPDYQDDFDEDVQLRGMGPRYRQPNLTRSMPTDLIRSEMNLGSSGGRANSGDMRNLRRIDSPVFMGGVHPHGNGNSYSPNIQRTGRTGSSKR